MAKIVKKIFHIRQLDFICPNFKNFIC